MKTTWTPYDTLAFLLQLLAITIIPWAPYLSLTIFAIFIVA